MKITIVSAAYPFRGGIAHFTGQLYNELIKSHNVNVITFKRQYPAILFPGKTQYETDPDAEKINSEILIDSINPINWLSVGKKIKKDSPDHLIFCYWLPFFAPCFATIARIVKGNKKTKISVINHNVLPHEKRPGDIAFTKYFFKFVDFFISLSTSVVNDLSKVKKDAKNILLYHPVYTKFGEVLDKSEARKILNLKTEKVLLFFGFIRNYKGLDVLLKAVALLKNKIDFTLLIAGEFYEDETKYLNLIDELKINDYIKIYKEFIPNSEVKNYFSAADVVVLPYKDATQSGIIQVANNFYKPVIATNVGGLPEVIEEGVTGNLVEVNNPEKLAESILSYFAENKESIYTENIKRNLEKLSWGYFSEQMNNFITDKVE